MKGKAYEGGQERASAEEEVWTGGRVGEKEWCTEGNNPVDDLQGKRNCVRGDGNGDLLWREGAYPVHALTETGDRCACAHRLDLAADNPRVDRPGAAKSNNEDINQSNDCPRSTLRLGCFGCVQGTDGKHRDRDDSPTTYHCWSASPYDRVETSERI